MTKWDRTRSGSGEGAVINKEKYQMLLWISKTNACDFFSFFFLSSFNCSDGSLWSTVKDGERKNRNMLEH